MKKCYLESMSNILHEIRKRKANWIGHILRRNCFLKQVIEGKIKGEMEVTRRRGRRRKKLLDDLKDRRGYSHLKEEALCGGIVLEETLDLSSDRILNERTYFQVPSISQLRISCVFNKIKLVMFMHIRHRFLHTKLWNYIE